MFLDAQHTFSDAQALTATAVSTNVIDLGIDRNPGIGEPMCVIFTVDVAADFTTGNETYQFDVQTATDAAITTAIVVGTRAVAAADAAFLAAGRKLVIGIPADLSGNRFWRINYTLGGTTPTLTVTAQLQPQNMLQAEAVYASGFAVS